MSMNIVDLFYPLVRHFLSIHSFRYICCGLFLTAISLGIFFVSYNFLLDFFVISQIVDRKEVEIVRLGNISLTKYSCAYFISLSVSFPLGFFFSKYVVFIESQLRSIEQLSAYIFLHFLNLLLNYFLLYFFVEKCGFWATTSQILITIIIANFSYLFQKYILLRKI
ncbi:GtrA family protein [Dyadobacter aurulentus]|uniref:GtrA family protein n=1 Tax=Dyadobacter sp. UC 10 TaxID=2605428 RepID=UPI0011F1A7C7|nr:hypothetical protein FXO21_11435 [Dyadobacter sp. UC 10]